MSFYIARDKRDDRLTLFFDKPERCENENGKFWATFSPFTGNEEDTDKIIIEHDLEMFPDLSWEDEPREVEIVEKGTVERLEDIIEETIRYIEFEASVAGMGRRRQAMLDRLKEYRT